MPVGEIQATLDAAHAQQVDNEMGTERYAYLFKPGTYGTADAAAAGQGRLLHRDRRPRRLARPTSSSTARSRSTTAAWTTAAPATASRWSTSGAPCPTCRSTSTRPARTAAAASANFWAVSQAVSMRRLNVSGGNLSLMDYCTAGPQYASGGFIADSRLPARHQRLAAAVADPQQRGRRAGPTRVWNQVFAGVEGAPDDAGVPEPAVHHAGHHPGQPGEAVPVRRRQGPLQRPRAVRAARTPAASPGPTA